ncbi:MAG: hypothetical protein R2867_19070 [Caldilineaceae bacterium]
MYTYEAGLGLDIYNMISTVGAFILALGVLVFLINFFYSIRHGQSADANPWGADSLEWGTSLPAPNYGFAELPIVHSRAPLWEQESIHRGEAPLSNGGRIGRMATPLKRRRHHHRTRRQAHRNLPRGRTIDLARRHRRGCNHHVRR